MGDAGETRALRLAATATKWLEDVSVDREGHVHPAVATGGQALAALATAGARVSLAEPGRVVCSLRVRAPLTVRRGGEVARRGHRGGGGQRVRGGGVHGAGRGRGHRPVRRVLLLAGPSRRGGGDGRASGGPEGEDGGCDGGGAEERVRRAGGELQAVDGTYPPADNKEQHKHKQQQALKKCGHLSERACNSHENLGISQHMFVKVLVAIHLFMASVYE